MGSLADRLNGVTVTQTRQSIGSQLREALDDMVATGRIQSWEIVPSADGRQMYQVWSAATTSLGMFAGECMDWLNRHGYDIRFGKNPSVSQMLGTTFTLPVGSVWIEDDGYRIKIVGHNADGWPIVRHASGRGNAWEVTPAWFETWERANLGSAAARREP